MAAISVSKFMNHNISPLLPSSVSSDALQFRTFRPFRFRIPRTLAPSKRKVQVFSKSSETELSAAEKEWLKKLPEKKKPLYSHSLPCIEAWLKKLGFFQSREDRAVWFVEKPDWHAQLSLDVTDLYIRYLKSGPGNLEKDVERRFSYALKTHETIQTKEINIRPRSFSWVNFSLFSTVWLQFTAGKQDPTLFFFSLYLKGFSDLYLLYHYSNSSVENLYSCTLN
ncbi:hypothetical protein NE237_013349 [Protea cynaroides]|uniref:Uncharacterized protein n=1 Tax=Protea cynaroides TaxID=273540 RepID=A0A9Q0JYE7_9MAGN|nr:hypothetical protein NE237_013349 [Protea cynaroides]